VDLDEAMAVTLDEEGKAKVHLSVDLSKNGATWARMWGSLLGATLFMPLTDGLVTVANGIALASDHDKPDEPDEFPKAQWWRKCLGLPDEFTRDVAGAISPGGSAIFMLLRHGTIPVVLGQLRNYGDTIIHTPLAPDQERKMQSMLALS
jgi:uncharacterized membrane protein